MTFNKRMDIIYLMKCLICGKKPIKNKYCSQKCYWKSLEGVKGKKAPNWKPVIGKKAVHDWLQTHYGKPQVCEMKNCEHKSKFFDWALKTGYIYERKRNNFMRLCRSCHRRYDLTEEKKKQAIKNLWWVRGIKCPGKPNFKKGVYYGNGQLV